MARAVLDSSAVLAILNSEPGAANAMAHLDNAVMSTVNLAEVAGKLTDAGMPDEIIRDVVSALRIEFVDFDTNSAYEAAGVRRVPGGARLSVGDRACIALGSQLAAPVVTADRAWADLDVELDIELIR